MQARQAHLTDGEDVVEVERLEQRPHGEVDVHEPAAKVHAAGKARDDLEAGVGPARADAAIGLDGRGGVELDEIARAGRRVLENFGDL